MPAIYLTEADVERLLNIETAIEVCEEAFRSLAAGQAENVPRARAQASGIILHSMSAAADYLGLVGWKCYTTTRQGARFHVGLYDSAGSLLALIEADRLGQLRTGATTGVAVEWMAEPQATEMGLFGSGWQAQSQLAAVARVRPIKIAYVYSRNEQKRNDFADRMSAQLGIDVRPVDRPQEAAEDLPIVVTATTRAAYPSAHPRYNIVCDSIKACQLEAGDFVEALEKGIFDWSRAVELSDVIVGKATGRNTRESIALFKSVGLALEDVALAGKLLELARAQQVGRELPF